MKELFKETILGIIVTELEIFTQVSVLDFLYKYEGLFQKYVDIKKLRNLLVDSVPFENYEIMRKAQMLAMGTKESIEQRASLGPLCSVFSRVSLDGSYPEKRYYTPSVLTMDNIMPVPRNKVKTYDYKNISEQFLGEMDLLSKCSPDDFDSFLITLGTLLKKYLWSVPVMGEEDVSLYDYIRSSIAIVVALMDAEKEDKPFVITAGHFSGIQNYIFSVSKVGIGGVTKRLRSRSFYVNAMVSALAHSIVHKFGLPMSSILMLTGGKFYILLPAVKDVDQILNGIERNMTEFLYEKFKGNLSVELVWEKLSDEEILDYSGIITRLSEKIDRKKNRSLESVLVKNDKWDIEQFIVYHNLLNKSMCKACRSALVDDGMEMCSNCEVDTEIGGKLPKIRQFSFSRRKGQYELLDGYYLNLDVSIAGKDNYLILKLNTSDISNMYDKPVEMYHTVNNVPIKDDKDMGKEEIIEVKTFSEIANESKGCKKIGILKADVDTLGFLFSEGLQDEEENFGTISRINTLSRMLDLFFNGYLHEIIEKQFKNVYCVFSGGDDLFLIGPWNEMPDLALEINKEFHRYTGDNQCMTLSAAICIASGSGHISTMSEYCEQKLKQVKETANRKIYPDRNTGRNGVFFLNRTMSWEDFEKQINIGKSFAESIPNVGISLLRRLGNYSYMYQNYLNDGNVDNLLFLPMFSYDMTRNYSGIKKEKWFRNYCDELYRKASNYMRIEKEFYFTEFSVQYAFNLTKEERTDG